MIRETRRIAREDQKSPAAARNLDLPLSRFPLRGQAGAGGFPPRRSTSRSSQRRWHAPCAGSPHKRGCRPLVDPLLRVASTAADAHNESLKEKIIGAVYTKYLTLPDRIQNFVAHHHGERNHQGLGNRLISPAPGHVGTAGEVQRRQRLGGMLNYYCRTAA